jgi:hypothetical protein
MKRMMGFRPAQDQLVALRQFRLQEETMMSGHV